MGFLEYGTVVYPMYGSRRLGVLLYHLEMELNNHTM